MKLKTKVMLILALGALFMLSKELLPKGFRNNNPGNIRHNAANDWLGQTGFDDTGYAIFSHVNYGIRAMGKVLTTYHFSYGINTALGVAYRWAPPSDNNPTNNYTDFIVDKLELDFTSERFSIIERLPELVAAIIEFENGSNPYSQDFIKNALAIE